MLLAAMFWAFTYALFTYRANLRYGDAYELISDIRLVSTLLGAGIYWLVLSRLIDGTGDRPGKPLLVVSTILPASIVILLARVLLDNLGANNPNGFAGDLRFVMVWGGYFGLWVSASFALRVIPRMTLAIEPSVGAAGKAAKSRRTADPLARAELLERLTLEVATLPAKERRALLASFATPKCYETADDYDNHPLR